MTSPDTSAGLTGERRQQIKAIVCDILEIDEDAVTETSLFKEDHDADSLRAIEILAALERTEKITIDQAELATMVNLAGVYKVVEQAAGR
ncbi:acyl carrier protein [Kibdelosporangium persicum]|uniref:Polyketide-8 synthase acyl carrier protein 1 n=1 Tax=Kibdelosporangium persicum TaxID=2698649 RepID=A0ABX2FHS4_9PSEU|nr:acyl carrier protein [Kibdelosporangium persicum]NRN70959.1 Polyketide-8 synthase acyl carrier protein 1 [Kibdelosporangium persicum]